MNPPGMLHWSPTSGSVSFFSVIFLAYGTFSMLFEFRSLFSSFLYLESSLLSFLVGPSSPKLLYPAFVYSHPFSRPCFYTSGPSLHSQLGLSSFSPQQKMISWPPRLLCFTWHFRSAASPGKHIQGYLEIPCPVSTGQDITLPSV